ncbi:pyridoxamine 5'-phosphate oxidase family protein [Streptomyces sp. NPDC050287]|uniref:pyridoxamine 5'-phosphate oxidase family protein n=1 Tax=Streptomyces sp. NPDC050287 TaxID=3365608 RepID=UPI0037BA675E
MALEESLIDRTAQLLDRARYLNMATVRDGAPWVATLQYAWFADPLHFVFGSSADSRHGADIRSEPRVSGSLFVAEGAEGADFAAVDGAQFTGRCSEIGPEQLGTYYAPFYQAMFPDAEQRAQWRLRPELLRAPAPHRLYRIDVERWWLIDTRRWAEDRIDRRVELPLDAVTQAALSARARPHAVSP